jgi:hypothetical protein
MFINRSIHIVYLHFPQNVVDTIETRRASDDAKKETRDSKVIVIVEDILVLRNQRRSINLNITIFFVNLNIVNDNWGILVRRSDF